VTKNRERFIYCTCEFDRETRTHLRYEIRDPDGQLVGFLFMEPGVDMNPKTLLCKKINAWIDYVKMEGD